MICHSLVTKGREMPWPALKLVAFGCMVLDHLVKAGLLETNVSLEIAGKMAFPLFSLSFGAGIAALSRAGRQFRWQRLLLWATIAQLPFPLAFAVHWTSLNMLFVFAAGWASWRLLIANRVSAWLAGVAVLILTWPTFSEYSYGIFGPLSVMGCLIFFSSANLMSKGLALCLVILLWWFVIPSYALMTLTCLGLLLVLAPSFSVVSSARWLRFGPLYALHIFLIAVLKLA